MFPVEYYKDEYCFSPDRIIFTENELHVPGLRLLAKHVSSKALTPLMWHNHKDAFEFSLLMEGNLSFSTENHTYPFYGGDVFISYPNEIHGCPDMPLNFGELYWFQLDISDPSRFLFLEEPAAKNLMERLFALKHHVIKPRSPELCRLLKNMFSLVLTQNDPYTTASCITTFLYLLLLSSEKEKIHLTPDIQSSLNYIGENITEDLMLETLAALSNLSVSQFKKKFKSQVGISPRNYINQQKIEAAKQFLQQGRSITDTAMSLSFESSNYFSVVFKKYTTMTPSEYLRSLKESD